VKLHFVVSDPKDVAQLSAIGVKCFLSSYYYMKKRSPAVFIAHDTLIDSGGFTARMKGIEIPVEAYAKWLKTYGVKTAFNLDVLDVRKSFENQRYLEKYSGAYIIPVYHLSDYNSQRELIAEFKRYPYVSVGGVVGEKSDPAVRWSFYAYVFKTLSEATKVHGLGITAIKELESFPWYSVDSLSWRYPSLYPSVRRYLRLPERMAAYASTEGDKGYARRRGVEMMLDRERSVTELWASRGVVW